MKENVMKKKQRIYLASDSTCANNEVFTYPCAGWGQMLHKYIESSVSIQNYAVNGRSSKSFIDEGRLWTIEQEIKKNDLLLIQFGHNDQKEDVARATKPYSTYQENLKKYLEVAKKKEATPIFITSLYRRHFNDHGQLKAVDDVHGDYPKAMMELAKSEDVLLIDLCETSRRWIEELGEEESKKYFLHLEKGQYMNYPEGLVDNTHLSIYGANKVAEFIGKSINGKLC